MHAIDKVRIFEGRRVQIGAGCVGWEKGGTLGKNQGQKVQRQRTCYSRLLSQGEHDQISSFERNFLWLDVFEAQLSKLTWHILSGNARVKDESTLIIENFAYDGLGPDAFFIASTESNSPPNRPHIDQYFPLPYDPESNEIQRPLMEISNPAVPILGEYDVQTIELKMPIGISAYSIKWISVYCRDYSINFGHAKLDNVPRS